MKQRFIIVCLAAVLFLSANASAQNASVTAHEGKGRYVDATVASVPDPEFPDAAEESGLGGRVSVHVKVDAGGNVISATPAGPDNVCSSVTRADVIALREAARSAAMKGTFSPAIRDGKPEAATITLSFDFPESVKEAGKETVFSAVTAPPPVYANQVIMPAPDKFTVKGDPVTVNGVPKTSPPSTNPSGTISGGVLNGKATSLPKPPYPAAARAVRASGTVNIQVLIDTDGSVFSAVPESGHPLLRSASNIAACNASFNPTQLSGRPVKVSGIITYNFVP